MTFTYSTLVRFGKRLLFSISGPAFSIPALSGSSKITAIFGTGKNAAKYKVKVKEFIFLVEFPDLYDHQRINSIAPVHSFLKIEGE